MSNINNEILDEDHRKASITMLGKAYEKTLSVETVGIYIRALRDFSALTLRRVVDRWIASEKWFPNGPACLREKAAEMASTSDQQLQEREKAEAIRVGACSYCDSAGWRYVLIDRIKRARRCTHKGAIEKGIEAVCGKRGSEAPGGKDPSAVNMKRPLDLDSMATKLADKRKIE